MARNLKPEYINKIRKTEAPNGYKFDLANYLCNPAYDCEYPAFQKVIEETPEQMTIRRVYYFKYYDGTGMYFAQTYTRKKNGESWQIVKQLKDTELEAAPRFNLKKLLSFCT